MNKLSKNEFYFHKLNDLIHRLQIDLQFKLKKIQFDKFLRTEFHSREEKNELIFVWKHLSRE